MNTSGSTSPPTETNTSNSSAETATPVSEENVSTKEAKQFPVIELFGPVIQGEGSQAGNQTMFIRFGGCDYRCEKCDSLHAVIPQAVQANRTMMTAADIFVQIWGVYEKTGVKWVTFSGGNPCMHKLDDLVHMLISNGFYINVETQGTIFQPWLQMCTTVTISPKSMGMGEKFDANVYNVFLRKLGFNVPVCVKVVVFSAQDLEFALHVQGITEHVRSETMKFEGFGGQNPFVYPVAYYLSLGNPYPPVLNPATFKLEDDPLTPTFENYGLGLVGSLLRDYASLSEEVLQDPRLKDFRFLPQLHVLVYGNESER